MMKRVLLPFSSSVVLASLLSASTVLFSVATAVASEPTPQESTSAVSSYQWQAGSGPRGHVLLRGGLLGGALSPGLRASTLTTTGTTVGYDFPVTPGIRIGLEFDWMILDSVTLDGGPLAGARYEGSLTSLSLAPSFLLVAGDRAELWLTPSVGLPLPSGSVRGIDLPGRYDVTHWLRAGLGPTAILWYDSAKEDLGWGADRPRLGLIGGLSLDARWSSLSARLHDGAEHQTELLFVELCVRLGLLFGA